jgi:branched-subunit amino acid aminotransferase/4-amino-4-deoxychorismate lyase
MPVPTTTLGWLWTGSAFASADSVPLTDRGFRYGMSLFESLRVAGGRVQFFPAHHQRLLTACIERDFMVEEAALKAAEAIFANAGIDGFARIYVTAGDGPPSAPVEHPRVFLFLETRSPETEESWEVTLAEEPFHPAFPGLKTAQYWPNCDALARARAARCEEALLFNDYAELVSACCANVFLVHEDRILTPSKASGCRPGVIREWVIKRRSVTERRLRREDVLRADEIFLTNSWLGIMPVATVEGRPLGPRSVSTKLAGELERVLTTSPLD